MRGHRPVGEHERIVGDAEVPRGDQLRLKTRGQFVPAVVDHAREIREPHARPPVRRVHHLPAFQRQRLRLGLQHCARHLQHLRAQGLGGLIHRLAADARPARGPCAAAIGHHRRVARGHVHVADLHAHHLGGDLREDRLGALPLLGDRVRHVHRARGVEPRRRPVLRGDGRAADAVEHRRGVGDLDHAHEPDAAIHALPAQPVPLRLQPLVVHHLQQLGEALLVRQVRELHPLRRGTGIAVVAAQVEGAQRRRVAPGGERQIVHQPLHHRHGDGVADGAVLAHRRLVLEHHPQPRAVAGEVVRRPHQVHHLIALDARGARIDAVGPDPGEVVDLHRRQPPLGIHRRLGVHAVVAAVDVGQEALVAVRDEFHRPLQDLRRRERRDLVAVGVDLDAEAAADILRHHPHPRFRHAEVFRDHRLHHVRRLPRIVHGQPVLGGVVLADHAARLQRHAGMAAEGEGALHHRGARCRIGRIHIADRKLALPAQVAVELGVDARRAGVERRFHVAGRGQFFVLRRDQRQRVLGDGAGLRHHHRHRLALPAGHAVGERGLRRRTHAGKVAQHPHPGRDRPRHVGPVEHRHNARQGAGCGKVQRDDPGMGIGRTQEGRVHHARQHLVLDEAPAPLQQPHRVRARHRGADIAHRAVVGGQRHAASSGAKRARATSSTASTMA